MDILRQQRDGEVASLWHFKIGGEAADGLYRLANLSRETTSPSDWLAANQAEAQALIDAGEYNEEFDHKRQTLTFRQQLANELDWLNTTIPAIDTMDGAQVRDVVKRLAQENRKMLRAWRYVLRSVRQ